MSPSKAKQVFINKWIQNISMRFRRKEIFISHLKISCDPHDT